MYNFILMKVRETPYTPIDEPPVLVYYGGGLEEKLQTPQCIYTTNAVSSLYFINFISDIYQSAKELAADFKNKRLLPITSGFIKMLSSPLNFFYSLGTIIKLAFETHSLALPFLKVFSPIIALAYTTLETARDILHLSHLNKIEREIKGIFSLEDGFKKADLLTEKIHKDPHFTKIFGTKIPQILQVHINDFLLHENKESLNEADLLIQKQFSKARFIYSISLVCLALSGLTIVLGIFLAPPIAIVSLGLIATAISVVRNISIPAYLYQPGDKLVMRDAFPDWIKNPISTIVDSCGKLSSKSRNIWTKRDKFLRQSAPQTSIKYAPSSSNQKLTPFSSSSFWPQQDSKPKKSDKQPLLPLASIPLSSELSFL
jgi:hypothetical protein